MHQNTDQAIHRVAPHFELRPMTPALADILGPAVAGIEPWTTLAYPAEQMTAFMKSDDPAVRRLAVILDGAPAGTLAIRSPWLRGPYLQLLALLPPYQARGLGGALLDWYARQAGPNDRWLWLCCSAFNTRAFAFYCRHGYEKMAVLPDHIVDGQDELLLRKRVARTQD